MNELISVIIPAYNGAAYIAEAIYGIKCQAMNTEIIVIDDASPDNSGEIAARLGCRVIRNKCNMRQILSKNVGILNASGSYIMFHDQDDVMCDGALARLYAEFKKDPMLQVAIARVSDFLSSDSDKIKTQNIVLRQKYYGLLSGAVLLKKNVFDLIGLFKPSNEMHTGERILIQDKFNQYGIVQKKIDFVATNRRIHDNNFGMTNQKKEYHDYAGVLRARFSKLHD